MTRFDPSGDIEYQLGLLLDGGLEFGENIRGGFVEVTIEEAQTPQEVRHELGDTPVGFIVIYKDKEGDVWGTQLSDWNDQILWLVSSVESQMVRLYVM